MMHEVHTSYRLVSMGVLPVWLAILLTVGAAAATLLLLRAELRARKRRRSSALLYAARVLLAACLGCLVLQPVLFIRREWDQPGVLALIADRSRSMLRTDRYPATVQLDLASALEWPGMDRREALPGQVGRHLLALQPVVEGWRQSVSAIHDELGQGLPWGAAFGETVARIAKETTAQSAQLRGPVEAMGRLETRLAPVPDPKLFAPLYLLADRLGTLRDALGTATGGPLDESRAAGLLRAHDDLLAALRAAMAATATLQQWCDERFLKELPQAARAQLDALSKESRSELTSRLTRQADAMADRHRIRLVGFEELTTANALGHTDLFGPIHQVLTDSLDEVVSGIVLLTDGRQNFPERPEVLRRLAGRDVPLLLAGVGVGGELTDVAIADYQLPGVLLSGEEATLVADLKSTVPKGTPIQIDLLSGGKTLASQSLQADGTGQARVTLSFRAPEAAGEEGLLLSVKMPGGDGAPGLSRQVGLVPHLLRRTARALVVAKWARWDVVYLLSALRGKPCRVDLALWGADAARGVRRGLGFGKIPDALAHLKRYSLVVLDGEPFPGLTPEDGQMLGDYVRELGGALMVIADGERWYGPFLSGLGLGQGLAPFEGQVMVPPESAAMLPAVSLSADGAATLGTWASLPPAQRLWTAPDQAIPLLAADGKTVLSVGFSGECMGRVYAFGCGDLFRLREWGRGEAVDRFLSNLLDDALQPVRRDEKAKLGLYPFAPRAGSTAHVLLDMGGATGGTGLRPVAHTGGTPVPPKGAQVTLADGTRAPLAFDPLPGSPALARATFRVTAAGPMTIEVPGVPPLAARAASSVSREDIDVSLDEATLRRLAQQGGGRYVPLQDLPRALSELPQRLDHRVTIREIRLWGLWWLLPALAALMVADWVLRRRNGLVL